MDRAMNRAEEVEKCEACGTVHDCFRRRYRVTFNAHRYSDHSDIPVKRVRKVVATCPEEAWLAAAEWRDSLNGKPFVSEPVRWYAGMIDPSDTFQSVNV